MRVSVITVVYNAVNLIERTILSVLEQTYDDFEYIVIDGASNDGTVKKIKKYSDKITQFVSESDSGIYEAMNKGVSLAIGDYCIFMNAGDRFVNRKVIDAVSQYLDGSLDYVLGNEVGVNSKGKVTHFTSSKNKISSYNLLMSSVRHQASFIKRSLLLEDPYDERLKLVSDWKFALNNLIINPHRSLEVSIDICFFLDGGLTATQREMGKQERNTVLKELLDAELYEKISSSKYEVPFMTKVRGKLLYFLKKLEYER